MDYQEKFSQDNLLDKIQKIDKPFENASDKYPCVPSTLTIAISPYVPPRDNENQMELTVNKVYTEINLVYWDEVANDVLEYRPREKDKAKFPKDFKILVKQIPIRTLYEAEGCKVNYLRLRGSAVCAHIIEQKCLETYRCKFIKNSVKYRGVALVAIEPMEMDVDVWIISLVKYEKESLTEWIDALNKNENVTKARSLTIRVVYEAVLCLWKQGGAYMDLKPANVMVKNSKTASVENTEIKLIDLGCVCYSNNVLEGETTFLPPVVWTIADAEGKCTERVVPCTALTLIWQIAVFYLYIYWPYESVVKRLAAVDHEGNSIPNSLCQADLATVNVVFSEITSLLEKCDNCPSDHFLENVKRCFEPIGNNDWRTNPKVSPPFSLENMYTDTDTMNTGEEQRMNTSSGGAGEPSGGSGEKATDEGEEFFYPKKLVPCPNSTDSNFCLIL